jgi:hypothetical protein
MGCVSMHWVWLGMGCVSMQWVEGIASIIYVFLFTFNSGRAQFSSVPGSHQNMPVIKSLSLHSS